jgi:hypothetical protein
MSLVARFSHGPNLLPYGANTPVCTATHPVHCMPLSQVACMTHHVTGLWALEAVKRLEVAMEDSSVTGEAKPMPEEEV